MSDDCKFKLTSCNLNDFDGDVEAYFDYLNRILVDTFVSGNTFFNNKPVYISRQIDRANRLERFYHIITRTEYSSNQKTYPDMQRCEAVIFIPKMLLCCAPCKNLLIFDHKEQNKIKTYIWCLNRNIMIVLENKSRAYYFITCFIVQGKRNLNKFLKRFHEHKNNKTKNGNH